MTLEVIVTSSILRSRCRSAEGGRLEGVGSVAVVMKRCCVSPPSGGSPESSSSLSGLRQRCAVSTDLSSSHTEQQLHRSLMKAHRVPVPQSADQMSAAPPPSLLQRSSSRSGSHTVYTVLVFR